MQDKHPIIIDKKKALISLESNPVSFRNFGKHLRNDRELVFRAVNLNCFNLGHASEQLRDDNELVDLAISKNGSTIGYASKRIQDDKEFALRAIRNNGSSIHGVSERLQDDEELIKEVLKKSPEEFKVASPRIKADKSMGLLAVKYKGDNIQYLSDELRYDKDIVWEVLNSRKYDYKIISNCINDELGDNEEIIKKLLKKNIDAIKFASYRLRSEPHIILFVIQKDPLKLRFASNEIRDACIGNDPIVILNKFIFSNKLNETLSNKKSEKKMKI